MPSDEVSGCLDRWFDDPASRQLAANAMVDAIEVFGGDSQAWALLAVRSQYDGLLRLQLMVRNVIFMNLREDGSTIVYFDRDDLGVAERAVRDHPSCTLEVGPHQYPTVTIPEPELEAVLNEIRHAARAHATSRAPKPDAKRSVRAESHSPAGIAELQRVTGRRVP